jgi:hypothetical protein
MELPTSILIENSRCLAMPVLVLISPNHSFHGWGRQGGGRAGCKLCHHAIDWVGASLSTDELERLLTSADGTLEQIITTCPALRNPPFLPLWED